MDNKFKIVEKAMDQIGFGQLSLYDEKDKVAQIDFDDFGVTTVMISYEDVENREDVVKLILKEISDIIYDEYSCKEQDDAYLSKLYMLKNVIWEANIFYEDELEKYKNKWRSILSFDDVNHVNYNFISTRSSCYKVSANGIIVGEFDSSRKGYYTANIWLGPKNLEKMRRLNLFVTSPLDYVLDYVKDSDIIEYSEELEEFVLKDNQYLTVGGYDDLDEIFYIESIDFDDLPEKAEGAAELLNILREVL